MKRERELQRLVHFFTTISPASLPGLGDIYAAGARFKDPFNDVYGLPAIAAIFAHMFRQVDAPRFVVTGTVLQEEQAFLTWEFRFRMKRFSREEHCIEGGTHVLFDADGKVSVHRDYWDAAEELYEKLPVLGSLMRWLKRAARR